jgi:serine protein kinase
MKIYDGEVTEEFRKTDVDVKKLLVEGRAAGEGMQGISPRFIINALNIALGSKEEKNCINPVDIIRALVNNFSHSIGMTEDEAEKYKNILLADKNSVVSEYKVTAKKEVNMAFLHAYNDQAGELFDRYMTNVEAFCTKEKVLDSVTGEHSDPDEQLMRSLEELIGIPVQSKAEFRNGIFVQMAKCLKDGKAFTFKDYKPLKEAIEKKLMHDLKNVVNLSIATTSTNPKSKKKRETALKRLMENGYCEHCASMLLSFVGEILRKSG